MNPRINSMKHKLDEVISRHRIPFGFEGHGMRIRPVIFESELEEIEQRYQVRFPDDYREFLLTIEDGGVGPGYGMQDVQSGITYERTVTPDDILITPFEHQAPYNPKDDPKWCEIYAMDEDRTTTDEEWELLYEYLTAGTIVLCHEGCGYLHRLVVTGPSRGNVWMDGDVSDQGFLPMDIDFLGWYERWLDDILAGGNGVWWMNNPEPTVNLSAPKKPLLQRFFELLKRE